ncbi:hypothetical protein [Massilia sp. YIM B04103]|uniref:hypothetical protein n=1 Tax=Massilia sp. YIM B04103 TaxID=2963106 RepID=UPI00210EA916|nr:hypothetical protein [Massilia sp. YIM B04103]
MTIKLRWQARLLCAAVLASAAVTAASAAGTFGVPSPGGRAAPAKRFTVGVENLQYYPLHTVDGANRYRGFARDVLDAFASQHGYAFEYVPLPINRLYTRFLRERTLDFKYPDHPKWREDLRHGLKLSYSNVVVSTEEGAMVLPRHRGRPLSEVRSMGTVLGFTPWPYRQAIDSKAIAISTSNSFDGLLRHALADHIDVVYMNVDVANYLLAEELKAPGGLIFDPALPHARSDFRLSTLQHPEVVEQFSQFLQREQGLVQKLRQKYRIGEAARP